MTSLKSQPSAPSHRLGHRPPAAALADAGGAGHTRPPPKPLVMGGTCRRSQREASRANALASRGDAGLSDRARQRSGRSAWSTTTARRWRCSTLVLCVTVTIALLGFGLQVLQ